jgi:hypothetical protein
MNAVTGYQVTVRHCSASTRDLVAYGIQTLFLESFEPRVSPKGLKIFKASFMTPSVPSHDAHLLISMDDECIYGFLRGERLSSPYRYELPKMHACEPCSKVVVACLDLFSKTTEPDLAAWVVQTMCIVRKSQCLTADMSPRDWASKIRGVVHERSVWGNENIISYGDPEIVFDEVIKFFVDEQNRPYFCQRPRLYQVEVRGEETKVGAVRRDWGKKQPLVASIWHSYTLYDRDYTTLTRYLAKHNAFMNAIREELLSKTRHR